MASAPPVRHGKAAVSGREDGSVWILAPAALLVLVALAAMAVDSAVVYLGQRQLANAAASAATDAAGAMSPSAFYGSGQVVLDPSTAQRWAMRALSAEQLSAVSLTRPPVVEVAGSQVCVALTGKVRAIFGRAIPGVARTTIVHARAVATLAGQAGGSVPRRSIC